jgi:hypothetical protein
VEYLEAASRAHQDALAWAQGAAESPDAMELLVQAVQEFLAQDEPARPAARGNARPAVLIPDVEHLPAQNAYLWAHRRALSQAPAALPAALGAGQESIQAWKARRVSECLKAVMLAGQPLEPLASAAKRARPVSAARLGERRQEPKDAPLPELLLEASEARLEAPPLLSPVQREALLQQPAERRVQREAPLPVVRETRA